MLLFFNLLLLLLFWAVLGVQENGVETTEISQILPTVHKLFIINILYQNYMFVTTDELTLTILH